tara:strand:+ start:38 stop:253 length:216 start_codon:yes stop_codon:yes gene_type:complete
MSVYRLKLDDSDIEVYNDKQVTALKKARKSKFVELSVKLPQKHLDMMSRAIGKHSSNEQLLEEFIKQVSKL